MKPQATYPVLTGTKILESNDKRYFNSPCGKHGRIMGEVPTAENKHEFTILEYVSADGETFWCMVKDTMKVVATI